MAVVIKLTATVIPSLSLFLSFFVSLSRMMRRRGVGGGNRSSRGKEGIRMSGEDAPVVG